ncbi:hypothetical protein [Rhizobium laguerreae]|uniref:hypothetical protein n=1 Tax=Rhizobium laguerreae TaxID=1076926 RepID=UPI001981CC77
MGDGQYFVCSPTRHRAGHFGGNPTTWPDADDVVDGAEERADADGAAFGTHFGWQFGQRFGDQVHPEEVLVEMALRLRVVSDGKWSKAPY